MSKEQVRVKKGLYFGRKGTLQNVKTISEFSWKNGEVVFDRSNARYLVEENIKEDVAFDLKVGCREYFEESDTDEDEDGEENDESGKGEENDEPGVLSNSIIKWACLQPQNTLKEVFGGADIVIYRATLRDIAKTALTHRRFDSREPPKRYRCETLEEFCRPTPHLNKPWARIALKAGDVILIGVDSVSPFIDDSEDEEDEDDDEEEDEDGPSKKKSEDDEHEKPDWDKDRFLDYIRRKSAEERQKNWYSGYKFEQYMTSDEPQGQPNPDKKLSFKIFETVMTGDLEEEGFEPIRICSFAEVDAFRGNEPIELKSTFKEGWMSKIHTYLHCKFSNKKTIVTGIRNEDYITTRVFERRTSDLEKDLVSRVPEESRADEKCFSFVYDVLAMTKHVLSRAKACRFVYLPKTGMIQFENLTVAEAMKRGHGFSEEFKTRFHID